MSSLLVMTSRKGGVLMKSCSMTTCLGSLRRLVDELAVDVLVGGTEAVVVSQDDEQDVVRGGFVKRLLHLLGGDGSGRVGRQGSRLGLFWDSCVSDGNIGGSATASTIQQPITHQGQRTTRSPRRLKTPVFGAASVSRVRSNTLSVLTGLPPSALPPRPNEQSRRAGPSSSSRGTTRQSEARSHGLQVCSLGVEPQ